MAPLSDAQKQNMASCGRTLLSWMRTSFAFIAFGFALSQLDFEMPAEGRRAVLGSINLLRVTAMLFIALGMIGAAGAAWRHGRQIKRIERGDFEFEVPRAEALTLSVFMALLLGGLLLFGIVLAEFLRN